jgi:hypothetical protein
MRKIYQNTPAAEDAYAKRAATRERVRRLRKRRLAGVVVTMVEVDEAILEYLAAGTQMNIDLLRSDRSQLAQAVRRALWHGTECWRETGRLDWRRLLARSVTR